MNMKHTIIIRGFPSGNRFVTNFSKWNTLFCLFEKICGVNSLVNLPTSRHLPAQSSHFVLVF